MARPEKVAAVADIAERMGRSEAVFFSEFRGMTVKDLEKVRASLREAGADYKVVKMTLARRAADDLGLSGIEEVLTGPTALTFAYTDPVATAKALRDAAREFDRLVVKGGILSGEVLPPEEVSRLADIEPREVLLAKIAGAMEAPLVRAAGLVQSFTRTAAGLFSELVKKKEQSGVAGAALPEEG